MSIADRIFNICCWEIRNLISRLLRERPLLVVDAEKIFLVIHKKFLILTWLFSHYAKLLMELASGRWPSRQSLIKQLLRPVLLTGANRISGARIYVNTVPSADNAQKNNWINFIQRAKLKQKTRTFRPCSFPRLRPYLTLGMSYKDGRKRSNFLFNLVCIL